MKKYINITICIAIMLILEIQSVIAAPASTNYELRDFGFGAGGTASSSSENYSLFGSVGEVNIGSAASGLYNLGGGLEFTINANVPLTPTFTNPSNFYNKLKIILNTGNNPTDAEFAIAISTDNFTLDRKYIQNDNSVGSTLGIEDWQTYAEWGGASGFEVIGLDPATTYTIEVSAKHGDFTQSRWSPRASASTNNSILSFDIDIASSDTETSPPYNLTLGSLSPSTVVTSTNKIWIDISTNATNGGLIAISDANGGLLSESASHTITSSTTDLTAQQTGYGARSVSTSQASGGPMQARSPYDGSGNNVGIVDSAKRWIFDSSNTTVTDGRVAIELKAKASNTTPSAPDYADILTIIATSSY